MAEDDDNQDCEHNLEKIRTRLLSRLESEPVSPRLRTLVWKLEDALAQVRRKQ